MKLVDRDVEAPDVFQVSDQALWDGRPSLGGVWVASPDAVDPERVILRNPANDYVRNFVRGVDAAAVFKAGDIARTSWLAAVCRASLLAPQMPMAFEFSTTPSRL